MRKWVCGYLLGYQLHLVAFCGGEGRGVYSWVLLQEGIRVQPPKEVLRAKNRVRHINHQIVLGISYTKHTVYSCDSSCI